MLSYLLAGAIVIALARIFNVTDWTCLLRPDWKWLLLGLAASLAANLVGTLRWRYALELVTGHRTFPLFDTIRVFISGTLSSLIGLGGTLGLAYQGILLHSEKEVPLTRISLSFLLEKLLDPLVCILVLALSCLYFSGALTLRQFMIVLLAGAVVLFLLLTLFRHAALRGLILLLRPVEWTYLWLLRHCKPDRSSHPSWSLSELEDSLRQNESCFLWLSFFTILRMVFLVLRLHFIATAYHFSLATAVIIMGMAILQLGLLFAPTPGGLGVAEWGWAIILLDFGLARQDAAFLSLAFRIHLTLFVLVVFLITRLLPAGAPGEATRE